MRDPRRPAPKWLRWFTLSLAVVVLGGLLYLAGTFVQVLVISRRNDARAADAIVVMGAAQFDGEPSTVFKSRLNHAAQLYADGYAPEIIVVGGKQSGDRFTEAEAGVEFLAAKGVPRTALVAIPTGSDSWESLVAARTYLDESGADEVLFVSSPYHEARILAIAGELGIKGYASPTRTSPEGVPQQLTHMVRETFAIAAGRIVGFGDLGNIETELQERVNEP